jgi:pyruvate dehydrogenase E2 component (dihydrolipoamide acetyltransferase)
MAVVVEMPKLTDTMEEGVIVRWTKKVGEAVEPGDVLAEIETDKATMEYEAADRGVLLKTLVAEGSGVAPGMPIAVIGARGEDVSAIGPGPAAPASGHTAPAPVAPASPVQTAPVRAVPSAAPAPVPAGRVPASPIARRLASEAGVDLALITGTGPGGRIVERDVERQAPAAARAAAGPAAPAAPAPAEDDVVEPLSQMRKAIARRMSESKPGVPHFYLRREIDADALVALREQVNADHAGAKVSFNDFVVRAVALGLRAVPAVNASFLGDRIVRHGRIDVGVAVALPEGLVTPVVRAADGKALLALARETRDLAERARARKLRPDEMQGGTFTVSNLGMLGIDEFAAILNPPEAGILAVGAVRHRAVVRDGAVVAGRTLALTLSCDHRAVDGAIGAAFLAAVADALEHPTRLVL